MVDLNQACTDGDGSRISQLLQQWKDTLETDEMHPCCDGDRCCTDVMLVLAARSGCVETLKYLMEPGSITNVNTVTAAIQSRNIDLLDYLMLHHPWKINQPGSNHYTPALGYVK